MGANAKFEWMAKFSRVDKRPQVPHSGIPNNPTRAASTQPLTGNHSKIVNKDKRNLGGS